MLLHAGYTPLILIDKTRPDDAFSNLFRLTTVTILHTMILLFQFSYDVRIKRLSHRCFITFQCRKYSIFGIVRLAAVIIVLGIYQPVSSQAPGILQLTDSLDKLPSDTQTINSVLKKGTFYWDNNNTLAKACFNHTLIRSKRMNYETGITLSIYRLGVTYAKIDAYEKALDCFIQALKLYEKQENKKGIADSYISIANVHNHQLMHSKAIEYYRKGWNLYLEQKDSVKLFYPVFNTGNIYLSLQKNDSAKMYYDIALPIAYKLQNDYFKGVVLLSYAGILALEKKYTDAADSCNKAILLMEKLNSKDGIATGYYNLADIYIRKNDPATALFNLKKSILIANEEKLIRRQMEAHEAMAQCYEMQKNYASAYNEQLKFQQLHDSLFSTERDQVLSNMRIKYESEKKEQENQQLKKESTTRKKTAIFSSLLLFITLILLFLILRNKNLQAQLFRQKEAALQQEKQTLSLAKKLEEEEKIRIIEEQKNSEVARIMEEEEKMRLQALNEFNERTLTAHAITMQQKTELLENLQRQLSELSEKLDEKDQYVVKSMRKSIHQNINFDDNWNKIKLHFEQVHPVFFNKLKSLSKELTVTDLKHCAYIKINLSAKEVASLLNVNAKSVRISRYRIKKKLHLSEEEDLAAYIMDI